jgi:hypothetical protein
MKDNDAKLIAEAYTKSWEEDSDPRKFHDQPGLDTISDVEVGKRAEENDDDLIAYDEGGVLIGRTTKIFEKGLFNVGYVVDHSDGKIKRVYETGSFDTNTQSIEDDIEIPGGYPGDDAYER